MGENYGFNMVRCESNFSVFLVLRHCVFLIQTYAIEDCKFYKATDAVTMSSAGTNTIADLQNQLSNVEITGTFKSSAIRGLIGVTDTLSALSGNQLLLGVDSGQYMATWSYVNGTQYNHSENDNSPYSLNSELDFSIKIDGTTVTEKLGGITHSFTFSPSVRYLVFEHYNTNSVTITYKNLKVKPL